MDLYRAYHFVWYVLGVQTRVEIIELSHEHTDNSTVITDNNNCNSVDYRSSDSLTTSSATATVQPSSSTSTHPDHQQLTPASSISSISQHQPAASVKRKSFFMPKITNKQSKASDTHNHFVQPWPNQNVSKFISSYICVLIYLPN